MSRRASHFSDRNSPTFPMYLSLGFSYWLAIPLAIVVGGFLERVFIIFRDCTNGSFFKSRKENDTLGFLTGVLTFTPDHQKS
jgi:acyl-lipid omega-6 desaturase (Delta-12 desaturase)